MSRNNTQEAKGKPHYPMLTTHPDTKVMDEEDYNILPNYDAPLYEDAPSPNTSPQPPQSNTWPPQRTSFEREVAQRAILRPQPQRTNTSGRVGRAEERPRRTPSLFALDMLDKAKGKFKTSPLRHSLVPQQSL